MMKKLILIEDAPKEIRESYQMASGLPVGYPMTYIRTFHRDGTQTRVEYRKASQTELEIVRIYEYY